MTPTIHNAAKLGEIAKTVLMPGDPVRAAFIAEKFLNDVRQVSNIRGIGVYTGTYKGKPISVMASGMGTSSMALYSKELFDFYEVDSIIRVGSAGGLASSLRLGDIVIAQSSSTDADYPNKFGFPGRYSPTADFSLMDAAVQCCRHHDYRFLAGPVFTGEAFYYANEVFQKLAEMGMLAVEMETAALYTNAMVSKKKALTLCTISDLMFTGECSTAKEREETFIQMIHVALEIGSDTIGC